MKFTEENSQFNLQEFLANLSTDPGIYQMFNSADSIIYVGKARNLKNRVSSYFSKSSKDNKTILMVKNIKYIKIITTPSDYEAFLLENNLIKKHKPKYNIIFKDDKTYPYIVITKSKFPRVFGMRGLASKYGKAFGPYVSISSIKNTLSLLQKTFPIRQCTDNVYNNRSRPCLQYQIKRCLAPCVDKVRAEDYNVQVDFLEKFLKGQMSEILTTVSVKMQIASENMQYENAIMYRNQLTILRNLQTQQNIDYTNDGRINIIGIDIQEYICCIVLLDIENGKVTGEKQWFVNLKKFDDKNKVLEAFLTHYYLSNNNIYKINEIILPDDTDIKTDILKIISKYNNLQINWVYKPKTQKLQLQNLAKKHSIDKLDLYISNNEVYGNKWKSLAEIMNITNFKSMVCFDISHFQGEATVASCVSFNYVGVNKNSYRKYNITGITLNDDYEAISQAVSRYLKNISNNKNLPELIVIDGGIGQFRVAHKVISSMGLIEKIKLISLGKGVERKDGAEDIIIDYDAKKLNLKPHHLAFLILRQIRNESHRFAITAQRNAVKKRSVKSSPLDDLVGIGAKRKKSLLLYFSGWKNLSNASEIEIAKVSGISKKLATDIWNSFR